MSDRKRKAAICCLIAASYIAMESRKKRKRELRNEYESKYLNSMTDADNTDCDQDDEEDEEDEEENYETSMNSGVTIKVEPGLNDEDTMDEYNPLNEEGRDPLEIDIDNSMSIKQEKHDNESSSNLGIKIKVEPNFSDDEMNNVSFHGNDLSRDSTPSKDDSHERCQSSKENSVVVKTNKVTNTKNVQEKKSHESVVKETNEVKDDCQVFGDFIAGELRNLKSEDNRRKFKRIIQKVIIEIAESEA